MTTLMERSKVAETLLMNLLKRLQSEALNEQDNNKILQKSLQIALEISEWDYAAASKLSEDGLQVELLSFVAPERALPVMSYDLLGTPCYTVVNQTDVVCYLDVQQRFADEKAAVELGIQSYIGMMYYISGEPVGHIYFMSQQKQSPQQVIQAESLLQLLSVFIGSRVELIRKQEELVKKQVEVSIDALTGIYNRRRFVQDIRRVEKQYKNDILSDALLIMLDVDGLKRINDSLGHVAGDEVIQLTTSLLLENFRKEDLIYRLGGDEFAVLVLGNAESMLESGDTRIERIRTGLRNSKYSNIGISFGSLLLSQSEFDFIRWVDEADKKMYEDKELKHQRMYQTT